MTEHLVEGEAAMASTAKQYRPKAIRIGEFAPSTPTAAPSPSPAPAREPKDSRPRYHAIDALRGMAMFLVISLHAALGYIERDIPGAS